MPLQRVHFFVTGRVQRVGYRRWAKEVAMALGISGWVRNKSDGSVELMAKGELSQVLDFLRACRKGPLFARVIHLDMQQETTEVSNISSDEFIIEKTN